MGFPAWFVILNKPSQKKHFGGLYFLILLQAASLETSKPQPWKGSDLLPPSAGTEASACPHTAAGSKSKALRSTELAPGGRDG